MVIGNYNFVCTCSACPEQYDVFDKDGNQVCYVRLRWGSLYAEYPDVGGYEIYHASIGDNFGGCFENDQQRQIHLIRIANAIDKHIEKVSNYTCVDCFWSYWEEDTKSEQAVLACDEGHCAHCSPTAKPCVDFVEE